MNVNGKVRLIARTKPGRERIYLTPVAKGHENIYCTKSPPPYLGGRGGLGGEGGG